MISRLRFYIVLGFLIFLILTPACGYRLAGGGTLPGGITTVCVSIFENRSTETGFESHLANDLIYEMTRNGLKVVPEPGSAQAVLTGVIRSVSVNAVSYSGSEITLENRVTVIADLVFRDAKGEVIWAGDGLQERQAYSANRDNVQADQSSRKDALAKLSRRFAESIYGRLTDNF